MPASPLTTAHPTGSGTADPPEEHLSIIARNLVKTYRPDVTALRGLSFAVPRGSVFGLLGPNGAGKSTTIRILTTLSMPDSGQAVVAGQDVLRHPDAVRRRIGCVGQHNGSDPVATGRENMLLAGRMYGMSGRTLRRRADDLLERFGLTAAANRPTRSYSGGMLRKLDVAIGLVHRPAVLFLDEPTTGLDPQARAEMWGEIEQLTHDGITILLTTHYLDEADRLADRLAIVDGGRIVVEGTPDDLKAELRGDALHIELADGRAGGSDVLAALARVGRIRDITVEGRTLHARADAGAAALPEVLGALGQAGIPVSAATVARPSLDDVYLSHTGRSYTADNPFRTAETAHPKEAQR